MSEIKPEYGEPLSHLRPKPCPCDHCRKKRGDAPTESQTFVGRIFRLPTLQDAVYGPEAKQIADKLDYWLALQYAEDEKEKRPC